MADFDVWQHTIARSATCAGIGVHSGLGAHVVLKPAPVNTGVVFVRTDITDRNNRVPALACAVVKTQLNTEIANGSGVAVSTIEHLMAALAALRIDNVLVEIDGPECPIMDGSALPFVQLLDRAGRKVQDAPRRFIEITERVEVTADGKMAALSPSTVFEVDFEIRYATPVIGDQRVALEITEQSFRQELAAARTFGFTHEVERLQAMGLGRGASLDNAVGIENDAILNPEGLRMERGIRPAQGVGRCRRSLHPRRADDRPVRDRLRRPRPEQPALLRAPGDAERLASAQLRAGDGRSGLIRSVLACGVPAVGVRLRLV